MHISRYALSAGVRHRVRTGEVQRGWPEGLPESGLKRHGVPEAPPDTSRGRLGRGLWMSGAVSCKTVPTRGTLICFISVSRLFRSISTDFRDRFDRAAVFTKIVI